MLDKLNDVEQRFLEIDQMIVDPSVISDREKYAKLMKERADMEPLVEKIRAYRETSSTIEEMQTLLAEKPDEELKELAQAELEQAKEQKAHIEHELKVLLLPKDPDDDKNVIMEIRGGAGGNEAALFAGDLFRMYAKYAEKNGWKVDPVHANENEIGGFKEIVFIIEGKGAYAKLKYEVGVHRVQRIPVTESGGRIHTSTVTVAVMVDIDDVQQVAIQSSDLQIDTYRASGAGGQHVNTTDSAIRITHIPTGLVVTCQDQRSQHKNKEKALRILKAKLHEQAVTEQNEEVAKTRKDQVGTGDRSERIRTYNYPQGRVTDHRIGLTLYQLEDILEGSLDVVIEPLAAHTQARRLTEQGLGE